MDMTRTAYGVIASLVATVGTASAQVVQGVVLADNPLVPQSGIEIQIIGLDRGGLWEVQTDTEGQFTQDRLSVGRYAVWARRIGYRPSLTVVELAATDTVSVTIDLEPLAVQLDGVTVYGLSVRTPGQEEFWTRRDKPWVQSVDYEQIEEMRPGDLLTLVQRILPFKTRCPLPMIYIDGLKQSRMRRLDDTPLGWVYGVEVFRNYYDIPTRYRDSTDPRSRCGAVFIWKTVPGQIP